MARPRGRPKTRGVWLYHLRMGNPQNMVASTEVSMADAKRAVRKFFRTFSDSTSRYGTRDEQASLVSVLMDVDDLDRIDTERWAAGPVVFEFVCDWGTSGKIRARCEVTRAKGTQDVEVRHGLV